LSAITRRRIAPPWWWNASIIASPPPPRISGARRASSPAISPPSIGASATSAWRTPPASTNGVRDSPTARRCG
jgi:hypothetical protein